jgi:anti-sigma regulatory factor (Ser/Thr protein kinase)
MTLARRLILECDLAELARLRGVAMPFLEECGASPRAIYATRFALEEAVSNIVRHAAGASAIAVDISVGGFGVELRIEDDGIAFDPLGVEPPATEGPLEERPTSGLGIHLLRQMAHELDYARVASRNRLTVRIRPGAA